MQPKLVPNPDYKEIESNTSNLYAQQLEMSPMKLPQPYAYPNQPMYAPQEIIAPNYNYPQQAPMNFYPPQLPMQMQAPMPYQMNYNQNPQYNQYDNNNQPMNFNQNAPPPSIAMGQPILEMYLPKSGFEKLMVPGLFVKQKLEWLEILTGCETENEYTVYATDVAGNKEGVPLFKCKEKSGCLNRNLLPGDCRTFKMEITNKSNFNLPYENKLFLSLNRPFECTFLCFNRPHIEVTLVEGNQNQYLGKVVHDFNCCEMFFSIYDKNNSLKYQIKGTIWQIGVHNRGQGGCICCKSCQQAFLFIHDMNDGDKKVGIIEKRGRGFTELISDADNFSLLFPIKATLEERTLLMTATLLLDFRYFETSGSQGRNQQYNNRHY